jgi:mRNA interferase RelE/StbE
MPYRLLRSKNVKRQIDNLPGNIRQRVKRILKSLEADPRPPFAELLHREYAGRYKIKFGEYRIVYRVDDERQLVIVQKVGKKAGPEFYQDLEDD